MIAINLGLDISLGTSGTNAIERPFEGNMIRNMAYLFDGLHAHSFPINVKSESNLVRYYTFVDDAGNQYIAIWHDGEAKLDSDKFASSIVVNDTSATSVTVMDPFSSTMQATNFTSSENGDLIIPDLLIKDYPIIIRLSK
jgi:hypothetical protein